jgi:hypothetical protein
MAKLTVVFGIILIILGVASFLLTGHKFPTSLIPAAFGILLAVLGGMARTPDAKRRMLLMHIAVTVGLLGFVATASSLVSIFELARGTKSFLYPAAIEEKAAMATLMLIFVILCARSFVMARRNQA